MNKQMKLQIRLWVRSCGYIRQQHAQLVAVLHRANLHKQGEEFTVLLNNSAQLSSAHELLLLLYA